MCGDINPNFSFNVTVVNTDNVEHKFKYSTDLVTDKVENGRYTLRSKALKKIEGTEVIVPANDKKTVTVSVDASDIDAAERDLQPKGYYLEGYTAFESLDGAENLSIPFVGFVGKWKELPAIEDSIYTMSKENREPIYYDGNGKRHDFTHFMTTVDGKNMVSGEYTDNNNVKKYSGDLIAFSPNADAAPVLAFGAAFAVGEIFRHHRGLHPQGPQTTRRPRCTQEGEYLATGKIILDILFWHTSVSWFR